MHQNVVVIFTGRQHSFLCSPFVRHTLLHYQS